ncbi:hypothetical protein H257_16608 [Aphanomyces astaci]|uniref:Exonuclease 1 n=1 Tax=Aphanomyces astaci TaxID=112090 RepID=W4FHT6_APHAT|nr:hypothetical protein H257_16608 [Aphanomyces astaci]ETV67030.1 hypothetical protein H257_16608 [Aphanomyces astaci]|eukprot:XP_009843399.1 hypothetical protein H257_16608 [Aphanomyces astaci]
MGIDSLLVHLGSVMCETHVSRFGGKRAGIDVSVWMYSGAAATATELALHAANKVDVMTLEHTLAYESYCISRLELLLKHNITPVVVFEGAGMPTKAATSARREHDRQKHMMRGLNLHATHDLVESGKAFARSLKITGAMGRKLRRTLLRVHPTIECIVAPYEADAELAHLSLTNYVDIVISEDSDLIPYGCATILYKMNDHGQAVEFRRRHIGACESFSFIGWSELQFLQLCVLAGCDYCPTVPGVGFVSAYKIAKACPFPSLVLDYLHEHHDDVLPHNFDADFYRALLTFRHHIVYNPVQERALMLHDWATSADDIREWANEVDPPTFLGNIQVTHAHAKGVANGTLHPTTYAPYHD